MVRCYLAKRHAIIAFRLFLRARHLGQKCIMPKQEAHQLGETQCAQNTCFDLGLGVDVGG